MIRPPIAEAAKLSRAWNPFSLSSPVQESKKMPRKKIQYDNIKQVAIKYLLKQEDFTLNRRFEDFAGSYGFKPILCQPYRDQMKGKVALNEQTLDTFSSHLA